MEIELYSIENVAHIVVEFELVYSNLSIRVSITLWE